MAMDLIAGGAAALSVIKDTFTALLEAKIDIETRTRIIDALTKIGEAQASLFDAQAQLLNLQKDIAELRKKIAEQEDWNKRLDPYALSDTPGGAVVYRYQGGGSAPEHFICPACVNKHEIHVLQDQKVATGIFGCPGCRAVYPVNPSQFARPR